MYKAQSHRKTRLKSTSSATSIWWEYRYPGLDVVTANELHVPVSDPTHPDADLHEAAFRRYRSQLLGSAAGGQNRSDSESPEQHVDRSARAGALSWASALNIAAPNTPRCCCAFMCSRADDFDRWVQEQRQPAHLSDAVSQGRRIFETTACINCHAVAGTVANGRFGPDLTHLMSRDTHCRRRSAEHAGKSAAVDSKSRCHQAGLPDAGDGVE